MIVRPVHLASNVTSRLRCRCVRRDNLRSSPQIRTRPVANVVQLLTSSYATRMSRSTGWRLRLRGLPRSSHQPTSRFVVGQQATIRPISGSGELQIACFRATQCDSGIIFCTITFVSIVKNIGTCVQCSYQGKPTKLHL